MVGLATQVWDKKFKEEHTRAPREPSRHCGHCNVLVQFETMQVLRDSKVTCIDCYNGKYREGEHPEVQQFSKKQFKRLSQAEREHVDSGGT